MMSRLTTRFLVAALALFAAPAWAQDDGNIERTGDRTIEYVPKDLPGEVYRFEIPEWSSAEIERIGLMLVGSWISDEPIAQRDGSDEAVHVWMHIAKTHIRGLDDVLYLEAHRDDSGDRPYRQSFAQLYEAKGKIRLRTLELARMSTGLDPFAGFWAIPDQFPLFSSEQVVATMDIELTDRGAMFEGRSPHSYPTVLFGAVEMRSEIKFDASTLAVADRGFGPDGEQVWGPEAGQWIGFSRDQYPLHVEQSPNGLTILTYPTELGAVPKDGQHVRFAYDGWLFDNGRMFASSDEDGVLPEIIWPPTSGAMNWAWEEVVAKSRLGSVKRFISPAERAYRLMGMPKKGVPPMARVLFHMEFVAIEDPQPADEETEVGSAG